MTDEQIELLRRAIQQEIYYESIDGFEHGAWGWAEQVANEKWKQFQESFGTLDELSHKTPQGTPDAL